MIVNIQSLSKGEKLFLNLFLHTFSLIIKKNSMSLWKIETQSIVEDDYFVSRYCHLLGMWLVLSNFLLRHQEQEIHILDEFKQKLWTFTSSIAFLVAFSPHFFYYKWWLFTVWSCDLLKAMIWDIQVCRGICYSSAVTNYY